MTNHDELLEGMGQRWKRLLSTVGASAAEVDRLVGGGATASGTAGRIGDGEDVRLTTLLRYLAPFCETETARRVLTAWLLFGCTEPVWPAVVLAWARSTGRIERGDPDAEEARGIVEALSFRDPGPGGAR